MTDTEKLVTALADLVETSVAGKAGYFAAKERAIKLLAAANPQIL